MFFTLDGGNYTVTSGNYTIDANGYVNYGMRRNGTYDIQLALAGTVTAKALFTVSRTINMGITGNVMVPVSGVLVMSTATGLKPTSLPALSRMVSLLARRLVVKWKVCVSPLPAATV